VIDLDIDSWKRVKLESGRLIDFLRPRDL
jgi:hypothetical protein